MLTASEQPSAKTTFSACSTFEVVVFYIFFKITIYGSVSSGRELALSNVLFVKVCKLAVTKREEQLLFFSTVYERSFELHY